MPPAVAPSPEKRRRTPSPGARPAPVRLGGTFAPPSPSLPPPSPLADEIAACAAEAREPNWDGYGAAPLAPAVERRARRLARLLPASLPLPEVTPAPSGSIDLEWRAGRAECLSLCVCESGPVQYDGRVGGEEVSGSFPLAAPLPARVASLLRSVAR